MYTLYIVPSCDYNFLSENRAGTQTFHDLSQLYHFGFGVSLTFERTCLEEDMQKLNTYPQLRYYISRHVYPYCVYMYVCMYVYIYIMHRYHVSIYPLLTPQPATENGWLDEPFEVPPSTRGLQHGNIEASLIGLFTICIG